MGPNGKCDEGSTTTCPDGSTMPPNGKCDEDTTTPPGGGEESGTPPAVGGEEGTTPPGTTPAVNRPSVVAGVEAFAPQPQAGVQPPAGVEAYAGPSASAGTPAGVLPMTGAGALMNTLAAAGLGLLVFGAATLRRNRAARG
jgi:LPXTG-motif cell wall-anchored protein